jgi:orotidine-5'-phosphate decarboxylase
MLKPILPKRFYFITPGIRLESSNKDDQERITTPLKAKNMGSTSLVIGRPITEAKNPLVILQKIYTQIN